MERREQVLDTRQQCASCPTGYVQVNVAMHRMIRLDDFILLICCSADCYQACALLELPVAIHYSDQASDWHHQLQVQQQPVQRVC